jgi:POT family proton-dependent oligopeptide transporter
VVNVFGAKQYHPLLQTKMISQYYVNFYMSINIGSLLGIPVMSVVAEHNTAAAYTIPAVSLGVGIMFFIAGSKRYVRAKPEKKALMTTLRILASPVYCKVSRE